MAESKRRAVRRREKLVEMVRDMTIAVTREEGGGWRGPPPSVS